MAVEGRNYRVRSCRHVLEDVRTGGIGFVCEGGSFQRHGKSWNWNLPQSAAAIYSGVSGNAAVSAHRESDLGAFLSVSWKTLFEFW